MPRLPPQLRPPDPRDTAPKKVVGVRRSFAHHRYWDAAMKHYILLPNRQIAETDWLTWGKWFETADRDVAKTETELHLISTVFLGIDHNFWDRGPPLLFETMVFSKGDGDIDWGSADDCWRYSSWDDAETGHKAAVRRVLQSRGRGRQNCSRRRLVLIHSGW